MTVVVATKKTEELKKNLFMQNNDDNDNDDDDDDVDGHNHYMVMMDRKKKKERKNDYIFVFLVLSAISLIIHKTIWLKTIFIHNEYQLTNHLHPLHKIKNLSSSLYIYGRETKTKNFSLIINYIIIKSISIFIFFKGEYVSRYAHT